MANTLSTPPTDHKSRDQRVVPVSQVAKFAKVESNLIYVKPYKMGMLKRCKQIRIMARDFSEDYDYKVKCCGKWSNTWTRTFHLALMVASCAGGLLYVMDSMNYTYCRNLCTSTTNDDQALRRIGPPCQETLDNSTEHFFCTHHVYKGIIDHQMVAALDWILTGFFTIELIYRAIVAPGFCRLPEHVEHQPENYKLTPLFHDIFVYFDIVSILPTYFELILRAANSTSAYGTIASIVNALKVLRVFRLFKTLRSFPGTQVIGETLRGAGRPLCDSLIPIVIFVFILGGSMMVATMPCNGPVGSEQCEIADLWSGGYFIVITITSVGYGDMVPKHVLPQLFAIFFMILGALLLAIPLAIIGNKFADSYNQQKRREKEKEKRREEKKKKKKRAGSIKLRRRRVGEMERESERQQRLLNTAMMLYARIIGVERRLLNGTETQKQRADDVMALNMLHQDIAEDTVTQMPIIDRHSKSSANLGRQLTSKVTVRQVPLKTISKRPKNNKTHTRKRQLPARLGSFRVKDLLNCCHRGHHRRMLVPRDAPSHVSEVDELRSEARESNSCRDKVWLTLNHPREHKAAFMIYLGRAFVVVLAIFVSSTETLDFINFYGADTVLCEVVVDQYCAKIVALPTDWRFGNNQYALNSEHYKDVGREDLIRFNNFCFPNVCDYDQTSATHNCTEPSDIFSYEPKSSCLYQKEGSNLTQCGFSLSEEASLANFCSYQNVSVSGRRYRLDASAMAQGIYFGDVPVCQRLACQDNSADRHSILRDLGESKTYSIMAGLELVFTTVFLGWFLIRLATIRDPTRNKFSFFKDFFNWIEFITLLAAITELSAYFAGMGSFMYSIWGLGNPTWLFYPADTFRFLRMLVVIRFIYMQKNLHSMIMIMHTFKVALPKVKIPVYFMILFIVLFAGLFFTFETVLPCHVRWVHSNTTKLNNRQYSDPEAMLLRYVYRDNSPFAGEICPLQDVVDGLWVAAVTWSTVGYGGVYPRTLPGQALAILCGLLGMIYMCMPLSVFGSTYYELHMQHKQRQKNMELTPEQKADLKRRFGKVMKVVTAGVHIKAKSNVVTHELSEQELHVYEYIFHSKIPIDEEHLTVKRVQEFKAQHIAYMQALACKQEEDLKYNETRIL